MLYFNHLLQDTPTSLPTQLNTLSYSFLPLVFSTIGAVCISWLLGALEGNWYTWYHSIKENWLSLSWHQSNANSSSAMGRASCPSHLPCWNARWPLLAQVWLMLWQYLSAHMRICTLCLENTHFLQLYYHWLLKLSHLTSSIRISEP